ncbi:cell envelope integrity protein CreD [Marinobacterium jannaschii]|uniref:cell envelope integrity protein CreD n=1 Tax=Marinobacterium jannaschii TaxID=64970 RepID=UPI000688168B|nr:cell envelope integrity protein CreD [Marinobacterium jannaschii]
MQSKLTFKILAILGLGLLLMVPLMLVEGLISERQNYRSQAVQDIASKWTGRQLVSGPLIQLPWQHHYQKKVWNSDKEQYEVKGQKASGTLILRPESLNVDSAITTSTRRRGIYRIPVYSSEVALQGQFSSAGMVAFGRDRQETMGGSIRWGKPTLLLLVSDMRGIIEVPQLEWNQQVLPFAPGVKLGNETQGVHAVIPLPDDSKVITYSFKLGLKLRGMEQLQITPLGKSSQISMQSDWPHPSFNGRHLPQHYETSAEGFSASWVTSPYSGDLNKVIEDCQQRSHCALNGYGVGAELIQPVDNYVQAERSVKYGLLFIVLTFIAFFLFEVLKKLQIHPVQYAMVGLALSVFYLLLVSLSEHMNFMLAYSLSTLACALLLCSYLAAVLGSLLRGGLFALGISLLYLLLYVIISSEDFALLMGATLIFAALATLMLMTRGVDWYQLATAQAGEMTAAVRVEAGGENTQPGSAGGDKK